MAVCSSNVEHRPHTTMLSRTALLRWATLSGASARPFQCVAAARVLARSLREMRRPEDGLATYLPRDRSTGACAVSARHIDAQMSAVDRSADRPARLEHPGRVECAHPVDEVALRNNTEVVEACCALGRHAVVGAE